MNSYDHDRYSERSSLHDVRYHAPPQFPRAFSSRESIMRTDANCCFGRAGKPDWWSQTGSNRRPPACKAGALPAELWPRKSVSQPSRRLVSRRLVGLGRFELPTSRLSSARSNQLSYKPVIPCQDHPLGPAASSPTASAGSDAGTRTRQNTARGSSMKKEKRRRRSPANGTR
jgi:hypothetical protein